MVKVLESPNVAFVDGCEGALLTISQVILFLNIPENLSTAAFTSVSVERQ